MREINRISNSSEMAPWDVPGNYSRPIARRIVEEARVPRNYFGTSKKAASVLFGTRFDTLSSGTRDEYYKWLRQHSKAWWSRGEPSYSRGRLLERLYGPYGAMLRGIRILVRVAPAPLRLRIRRFIRWSEGLERNLSLFRYTFPWAVEKTKVCYGAYHKRNK